MPTNDVTTPAVILAFTMSASLTSITPVKVAAVATTTSVTANPVKVKLSALKLVTCAVVMVA